MLVPLPLENGVLLRKYEIGDAAAAMAIEYDPDVKRYICIPSKDKHQWLRDFESGIGQRPAFAVVALPERVLAGRASLSRCVPDHENRELRIVIGKTFWGRGLGEIVAGLLIRVAFGELGATSVFATVHPENSASLELLERHRFTFVEAFSGPQVPKCQQGHLR